MIQILQLETFMTFYEVVDILTQIKAIGLILFSFIGLKNILILICLYDIIDFDQLLFLHH